MIKFYTISICLLILSCKPLPNQITVINQKTEAGKYLLAIQENKNIDTLLISEFQIDILESKCASNEIEIVLEENTVFQYLFIDSQNSRWSINHPQSGTLFQRNSDDEFSFEIDDKSILITKSNKTIRWPKSKIQTNLYSNISLHDSKKPPAPIFSFLNLEHELFIDSLNLNREILIKDLINEISESCKSNENLSVVQIVVDLYGEIESFAFPKISEIGDDSIQLVKCATQILNNYKNLGEIPIGNSIKQSYSMPIMN